MRLAEIIFSLVQASVSWQILTHKLVNYSAFYPGKMDACYVNDEKVQAQEVDFYDGWITRKIVGPFKGGQNVWLVNQLAFENEDLKVSHACWVGEGGDALSHIVPLKHSGLSLVAGPIAICDLEILFVDTF